jgi:hypothetical protein
VPAFFVVADRVKTKLATLMPRHAEEEPEGEEATAH